MGCGGREDQEGWCWARSRRGRAQTGLPLARQRCTRCTDAQRQPLRREGGGRSSWEAGGGRERRMGSRGGRGRREAAAR
ncbi:hypothetical protein NDU88_002631 [Pleurodeles waltl]|uniref:Uncharacterized protein n=1 Tax=Pleurodeles waltl TaxID=8319 RepID=A0AAV7T2Y4_PLEWA|nr:hypothetical protein NDU88_002631 [Pleurodeles waltl]